jgi:hypothetical protein
MTHDKRTTCGTCGQKARFIGSHVINAHLPYNYGGPEEVRAALIAERTARFAARTASKGN